MLRKFVATVLALLLSNMAFSDAGTQSNVPPDWDPGPPASMGFKFWSLSTKIRHLHETKPELALGVLTSNMPIDESQAAELRDVLISSISDIESRSYESALALACSESVTSDSRAAQMLDTVDDLTLAEAENSLALTRLSLPKEVYKALHEFLKNRKKHYRKVEHASQLDQSQAGEKVAMIDALCSGKIDPKARQAIGVTK